MTNPREARYALALLMATWPNGDPIEGVTKRLAELMAPGVVAVADTELKALRQECRDRECTEQDVRARLADAENTLADLRASIETLADQQWMDPENYILPVSSVLNTVQTHLRAALDGKP